jgi:hypothetical protein
MGCNHAVHLRFDIFEFDNLRFDIFKFDNLKFDILRFDIFKFVNLPLRKLANKLDKMSFGQCISSTIRRVSNLYTCVRQIVGSEICFLETCNSET